MTGVLGDCEEEDPVCELSVKEYGPAAFKWKHFLASMCGITMIGFAGPNRAYLCGTTYHAGD